MIRSDGFAPLKEPSSPLVDELVQLKVNTAQLSAEKERFNTLIERVATPDAPDGDAPQLGRALYRPAHQHRWAFAQAARSPQSQTPQDRTPRRSAPKSQDANSALHPDREADPEAHKHKTTLMGKANAAYERRDLLALLQLQLRIEQVDSVTIGRMAHSRLVALSRLLSEQAKALKQDLLTLQLQLFDAFS